MDREKVIKGFTVCSEHGLLNGEDCHGHYEYTDNLADIIKVNDYSKQCPYNGCKTGCVKTLAKDVFALLKEQEMVVHCGDCENFCFDNISPNEGRCMLTNKSHSKTWFCAYGKREKGTENDSL